MPTTIPKPEGVRFRLEITGRAGWFVPAFEAVMPRSMPRADVQERMARAMATYGEVYIPDETKGEAFKLAEVERRPFGCRNGSCKVRR